MKIKRCTDMLCKRLPWTCRVCGAACCDHRCNHKLLDHSATCFACARKLKQKGIQ